MWISPAYAQAAGLTASGLSDTITSMLPLVMIFGVFWFLLIRPQQSKLKEQKAMLSQIRRGDRIVTGGGVIGTVAKVVSDEEIAVDIAENVRVRVLRSTVASVLSKTEPVASSASVAAIATEKVTEPERPFAAGLFASARRVFKR